jgi:hypothetical protein
VHEARLGPPEQPSFLPARMLIRLLDKGVLAAMSSLCGFALIRQS